jgi:RND superfamily putative drug exporter
VVDGFRASSRVVTAAALIMTSVFVAFIPGGPATIKQIALGLAVGVFVDAFLVRMTLVPAVLALLGRRAWWLPRRLDRALPVVDVEGAALHRKVAFDDYQAEHGPTTLLARDVVVPGNATPVQVSAEAGRVHHLAVPDGEDPGAVGRVLAGRRPAAAGEVVVDGLLLPEQRESVIRRTALLELVTPDRSEGSVTDRVRDRARLESLSGRRRDELTERALRLVDELAAAAAPRGADGAVAAAVVDAALGLSSGVDVFVFSGLDRQTEPDRRSAGLLAEELARRGATVVVVAHGTAPARPPVPLATNGNPPDPAPPPVRAGAPVPDDTSVRTNDE